MKKQVTKILSSGILASFLAGTIFMIAFLLLIDIQTPKNYDDGTPRMNCFGGLQYGIAIAIQILLLFANLPAFLNLFKPIRENKYMSFLMFFGLHFLYLIFIITSISEFSNEELVIVIPWINWIIWGYYFFKLRNNLEKTYK